MASYTYSSVLPGFFSLDEILRGTIDPSPTSTTFIIRQNLGEPAGAWVEITGTGFTYDGDDVPTGGSITGITFFSFVGTPVLVLSPLDGSASLSTFYETLQDDDPWAAMQRVIGASTFIGTNGDDRITAFGEDTLIGGAGNDTFYAISGVALIEGGTSAGNIANGEFNRVVVQDGWARDDDEEDHDDDEIGDATVLRNVHELDLGQNWFRLLSESGSLPSLKVIGGNDSGLSLVGSVSETFVFDVDQWNVDDFDGALSIDAGESGSIVQLRGEVARIYFYGGGGNDTLDLGRIAYGFVGGGEGFDFLRVDLSDIAGPSVFLGGGSGYFGNNTFRFFDFEQFDLTSGSGNDRLDGGAYADTFRGGDGMDDISGGGGGDVLEGGDGADRISGNDGDDELYGGAGLDLLSGDDGKDTLDGGSGIDQMAGGDGDDLYYVDNRRDVLFEDADEGHDTVRSSVSWMLDEEFEDLRLTGSAALAGTGNELDNLIVGNGVANTLMGGLGNDTLTGGDGRDLLTGGAGLDRFDFNAVSESGITAATRDVIFDFKKGQDKIDLSTIDANTTLANDQAFSLLAKGTASSAVGKGKIGWYQQNAAGTANDKTILKLNVDNDAQIEMTIELRGLINLTAADFIL